MSKILLGDACAHMLSPNTKTKYIKIGAAFRDSDTGNVSVKVDTLPIDSRSGHSWSGWINIFERASGPENKAAKKPYSYDDPNDDIPF